MVGFTLGVEGLKDWSNNAVTLDASVMSSEIIYVNQIQMTTIHQASFYSAMNQSILREFQQGN